MKNILTNPMTTIPEKYARIILTAVKMGDTGSVPLEQLVAENIERAIEEAGASKEERGFHAGFTFGVVEGQKTDELLLFSKRLELSKKWLAEWRNECSKINSENK